MTPPPAALYRAPDRNRPAPAMDPRLDAIDRQLLSLLQANAREPAAILARKLHLARSTVVARIARLERDGVIAGYGVRLGQRLEEAAVRAYCFLSVLPKTPAAVMRELARIPEVEEISSVSGAFDYLVFLRCETHEQLDDLLDHIGLIDGVKQTQTSIVLSRKLDRRSAIAPG
ncbi:Putative regulatory protein [Bordetella bronchiseptica MO149]|uniref:Regulatory protein n=2 Tax=Alcaligenaceae TaxID=506 RepID=A0A0T7CP67_BORP1|nr:AsnC family transcriptional regulator [Bordetella bronchiseptica]KDC29262.1 transcriptional regulator, AsnC family [Bordetella bronchiseptica F2]PNO97902.1 Lrp/AsnC family transcriptional regulator [Bordetella pertussis 18323]CCJ59741.1 Putative regulatory protein [Bordetella bronchiseptica MO149]CCN05344.1 Putative regulatory protein [Bordetella bronchiseptica Bbr77]